jgi:hypothetical protein
MEELLMMMIGKCFAKLKIEFKKRRFCRYLSRRDYLGKFPG